MAARRHATRPDRHIHVLGTQRKVARADGKGYMLDPFLVSNVEMMRRTLDELVIGARHYIELLMQNDETMKLRSFGSQSFSWSEKDRLSEKYHCSITDIIYVVGHFVDDHEPPNEGPGGRILGGIDKELRADFWKAKKTLITMRHAIAHQNYVEYSWPETEDVNRCLKAALVVSAVFVEAHARYAHSSESVSDVLQITYLTLKNMKSDYDELCTYRKESNMVATASSSADSAIGYLQSLIEWVRLEEQTGDRRLTDFVCHQLAPRTFVAQTR